MGERQKRKRRGLTRRRADNNLTGRYMRVSRVRLASRIATLPAISGRVKDKRAVIRPQLFRTPRRCLASKPQIRLLRMVLKASSTIKDSHDVLC